MYIYKLVCIIINFFRHKRRQQQAIDRRGQQRSITEEDEKIIFSRERTLIKE